MKCILTFLLCLLLCLPTIAQETDFVEIDELYREDQFYAGITYNLLAKRPDSISQNGFSSGVHIGFIRDIPLNKRRNIALGIGLGYSGNSFNQNLKIGKDELKNVSYEVLSSDANYTKNKFALHMLELPLEFRWRSSSVSNYKFWRIYAGFKLGYLITHTTKFQGSPSNQRYSNIDHFNNLQYGLTASLGYNTWNVHLYYGLNPIFTEEALLNGDLIEMRAIKIGLIFYLL